MTQASERTATLSALVAAEVRAVLGRQDVTRSELGRRMGENAQWVSSRLTGQTPINLNDLQRMADALDVRVIDLLPGTLKLSKDAPGPNGRPDRPVSAIPSPRHTTSRPLGPSRRDITRPSSPVPPSRRRPSPVRPGDRAMAA